MHWLEITSLQQHAHHKLSNLRGLPQRAGILPRVCHGIDEISGHSALDTCFRLG